ncbi:MAG TPA: DUF302 domain-containing protein [Planctomycetota bacterium]|nr:DUF302 domain-containing protein [Planctomycetota bacterium]
MLLTVETTKTPAQLREDLSKACAAHQFGVLGIHDLGAKLKEKGVEFSGEALVFEICNPHQAKKVLDAHPELSTALPCRISAYRGTDGKTRLATIRPTRLIGLFDTPTLRAVGQEVEEALEKIMREAVQ